MLVYQRVSKTDLGGVEAPKLGSANAQASEIIRDTSNGQQILPALSNYIFPLHATRIFDDMRRCFLGMSTNGPWPDPQKQLYNYITILAG